MGCCGTKQTFQQFQIEMKYFKQKIDKIVLVRGDGVMEYSIQIQGINRFEGKYYGQSENNKPHGYGIIKSYDDNRFISAQWQQGTIKNRFILQEKDNNVCYVEEKNGKVDGKIVRIYKDGGREQQEYKNGKANGMSRFFENENLKRQLLYKNGKLVNNN